MFRIVFIIGMLATCLPGILRAQEGSGCPTEPGTGHARIDKVADYVDFSLDLRNNHIWRGIEVNDGIVFVTQASVHDKKQIVNVGIWSGTNSTGDYKELDYFAELKLGGFKFALWDIYNYSPDATYNNREFFNYSSHTTGRFLDAILSYNFGKKLPLNLAWSTIVFGRDRNSQNTKQKYSTYISAEYAVYQNDLWRFDVGCGGTFTLNRAGEDATFYSDHPGIVDLHLQATRRIHICKHYTLPVYGSIIWNPECDRAFFQIGAQVFTF